MSSNTWIEHVKNYAKQHNMKYNDALKLANQSYISGGSRNSNIVKRIAFRIELNLILIG